MPDEQLSLTSVLEPGTAARHSDDDDDEDTQPGDDDTTLRAVSFLATTVAGIFTGINSPPGDSTIT